MGKRSNFERNERDYYPTPYEAVVPLLPHLHPKQIFVEPCAGDGRLISHLEKNGHQCKYACDIEPLALNIHKQDILFFGAQLPAADLYITNPPWEREYLHKMIDRLRIIAPTWLLFDADWMHTTQAKPYLENCAAIVSVGRVKWIEGTNNTGMDNCCWYLFLDAQTQTRFHGR